jgi:hypothetical protein
VRHTMPGAGGATQNRFVVIPYDGGAEKPLTVAGSPLRAVWSDSQHVAIATRASNGRLELIEIDVRSGTARNRLVLPDSVVRDYAPLPNGWSWIPASSDRVVVMEGDRRRDYPKPAWFGGIAHLAADPARRRVLYIGWGGPSADTVGLGALSIDDGANAQWLAKPGESGRIVLVDGHDALLLLEEASETWSLHTVDGPGRVAPLGRIARPLYSLTASRRLDRVVANVRDYRADAWMSRVIRP